MLICGRLVQVLKFCIARVKLCLTIIAVRIMAGSYVQLIIMHNFGKFQPGMLVLIIWQRHIVICFSLGLGFHCLHTISNTCVFWVNIVPTSGSMQQTTWKFPHRIKYCTIKKQKTASPAVEPSSSARARNSLTTAQLCNSVFGEVTVTGLLVVPFRGLNLWIGTA